MICQSIINSRLQMSYFFEYAAFLIPSVDTVKHIVTVSKKEKLNIKENNALLLIAYAIVILHTHGFDTKVYKLSLKSSNTFISDLLVAMFYIISIAIYVFIILALTISTAQAIITIRMPFKERNA